MEQNGERGDQKEHADGDGAKPATPGNHGDGGIAKSETDKTQTREIRDLERRAERRERITIAVASVAVLVAGGAWWTSERQLAVMRKQLNDAEVAGVQQQATTLINLGLMAQQASASQYAAIAMQNAAVQNKRAADASTNNVGLTGRIAKSSERSIEAARESVRLDQRAWIGIDNTPVPAISLVVGQPIKIPIAFRNTGKTPALDVRGFARVVPVNRNEKPSFDFTKVNNIYGPTGAASQGLVPPNAVFTLTGFVYGHDNKPLMVAQPHIDEFNSGTVLIYALGRITYSDIFGTPHWVTYCYYWDTELHDYAMCNEHNEADTSALQGMSGDRPVTPPQR